LRATTIVEALIRIAPTAGDSEIPAQAKTPAATGTAIALYPVAQAGGRLRTSSAMPPSSERSEKASRQRACGAPWAARADLSGSGGRTCAGPRPAGQGPCGPRSGRLIYFVGLATIERLHQIWGEWLTYQVGINRIRRFYVEVEPDLERYFVLPTTDDAASSLASIGWPGAGRTGSAHRGRPIVPRSP
jgi:hypothetical protein